MFTKSARFYDAIYSFKDYAGEAENLRSIISSTVARAQTLLDVACGTGLHLEHLREKLEVVGLDIDPDLLRIAGERNPGVRFENADMLDFDLQQTFDVVTCLFSSIGYAESPAGLRQAASAMARHVAPGGVLILEPWIFPNDFETGRADALVVDYEARKIVRAIFSERRGDQSVLHLHYLVREPDGEVTHFSERHVMGLFSKKEYEGAIEDAGLRSTFDPDGLMGRGLFVATRPD